MALRKASAALSVLFLLRLRAMALPGHRLQCTRRGASRRRRSIRTGRDSRPAQLLTDDAVRPYWRLNRKSMGVRINWQKPQRQLVFRLIRRQVFRNKSLAEHDLSAPDEWKARHDDATGLRARGQNHSKCFVAPIAVDHRHIFGQLRRSHQYKYRLADYEQRHRSQRLHLRLGAGIFFLGYALFEVPSNVIMEKVGARLWIARIMITCGITSGLMAVVTGPASFLAMRFLLGLAEAGFFPGVIFYLAKWYPAEYRGRAISGLFVALPLADGIVSILSAAIL